MESIPINKKIYTHIQQWLLRIKRQKKGGLCRVRPYPWAQVEIKMLFLMMRWCQKIESLQIFVCTLYVLLKIALQMYYNWYRSTFPSNAGFYYYWILNWINLFCMTPLPKRSNNPEWYGVKQLGFCNMSKTDNFIHNWFVGYIGLVICI